MGEKERWLKGRDLLLVDFTLFLMFSGAGNLIFPPDIVTQAGIQTWPAILGLALSVMGLSVLEAVAVARSGGLDVLGSRVYPVSTRVFTIVAYPAIGPRLTIPRTATTSFEMVIPPFVGADAPIEVYQLVYSLMSFTATLFIALRPEKPTDRLGEILCLTLVALIVIASVDYLVNLLEGYGPAAGDYMTHTVVEGLVEGYQAMDTIAALTSGIVIAVNIRVRGVEEEGAMVQGTIRVGVVAGGMLLATYCTLAHIGALSNGVLPNPADGTEVLTNMVGLLFGTVGSVLLADIFPIACFNVCVGLTDSCGEHFHSICPRLNYRGQAMLFALVSMVISNAGLAQILKVSASVLGAIHPVTIVLIALSFFQRWLEDRHWVYPAAVLCTGVFSVFFTPKGLKAPLDLLDALPLTDVGLGQVLPAGAGVVLDLLLSDQRR